MTYRCSCGASFEDVEQYMGHKRSHQEPPQAQKKGVMCLGCGATIPTPDDYAGMVSCPSCRRNMKVVVQGGEVQTAVLR
ncbi:MAG: hypothetical protein AAB037_01560 [Chloroflexota bacterium]